MPFSTNVKYGVLRELGWTRADHISFVKMIEEHWASMLDLDKLRGKGMMAAKTVVMDGASACVTFKQPPKHTQNLSVLPSFA